MTTGLLELVPGLQRKGATNGGEFAAPCPWCGGKDRFRLWPEHPSGRPRWWCRRCERRGDGIDLLREMMGLSFREAADAVGRASHLPAAAPRVLQQSRLCPPNTTWQSRAEKVAKKAEAALWGPQGARALSYLQGRGFASGTLRDARLGYLAEERRETPETWGAPAVHRPLWLPRGIVIPWRACGSIWRLNIRRPAGEPRYIGPAGSGNGLYGADVVHPGRPVVMCEGELDALAVAQEAGDLASAVATGSTSGARHRRWLAFLLTAPEVLVAFDGDAAGEKAAAWWLEQLPNARRLMPQYKDAAGMLEAGADVRGWVLDQLALEDTNNTSIATSLQEEPND